MQFSRPSVAAGAALRQALPGSAAARRVTGGATALAGALSFGSAITPNVPWRNHVLTLIEPGAARGLSHVLAAGAGLALVYLGWGIVRGRRRAARSATIVLVGVAIVHLLKGLDYEEASVALALAALVHAGRSACVRGGGRPRPGLLAVTVAVGAVAAAYTLNTAVLLVNDRARGLGSALGASASTLAHGAWWLRSGEPAAIALDALVVLALLAAAAFLHALLRPAEARHGHTENDHRRAAAIVAAQGEDSLDAFSLREDKAFHFAHGGFLAYRTLRETAVVSGDPVGPPGCVRPLVADFLRFAAGQGWDVVLTAVSPRYRDDYHALGLRTICIGEEAVVAPERFSLEGRAIRKVRQAVTRVERRGWSIEVLERLAPDSPVIAELDAVEETWRAKQPRLHGFAMSLGGLRGAAEQTDSVYAIARGPDRRVCAFVRLARYRDGLSLDAMRREDDEPNGLNDALIAHALLWARERGIGEVSLNFAGFAHVMASRSGLTRAQRVLRWLLERVHGRFQLERLVRFNDKFGPDWRPRYLVYGARTHLPLAALRVLQAEAYIRPPRGRPLPRRWTPVPPPVAVPHPVGVTTAGALPSPPIR